MKRYIGLILSLFLLASPVCDCRCEAKNSDSLSCWTRLRSAETRWRFISADKIILSITNHGNGTARLQLHCENTGEAVTIEISPGTTHSFRFEKNDASQWCFKIAASGDNNALVAIAKPI
ncbi:MAG: hypothetical protein HDS41_04240 [Bacteroides sp.]|nr:hypothetical protein [Bacteroides sp.]